MDSTRRDTSGRVVAGPLSWVPPEAPRKNGWALAGGPIIVVAVLLYFANMITLPYVELAPGGADAINQLVSVPKDKSYPPRGSFLLTTVSLRTSVHPTDMIQDWLDRDIEMIPKKDLLGGSSQQDYNQTAIQDMAESKQAAAVVALRALGYPVTEHGSGALVTGVAEGSPADGVLEPGDAITSIDGTQTPLSSDAVAILQTHKFGDSVTATITRANNANVTKTLTLGSRSDNTCTKKADTGAGPCLGVLLGTKQHKFDFPFDVKIDTAGIGGPSAGLAFTLALIDELTPGELTGGVKVAVTGTIDVTGKVGEVGGVVQKTAAVRKSGAKLFLVPPPEYNDAATHAGKDLKVIKVATLQEALAALAANGGDVPDKLAAQSTSN